MVLKATKQLKRLLPDPGQSAYASSTAHNADARGYSLREGDVSRSYIKPIPIVTTYEEELPEENASVRPKSVAPSTKANSVKAPTMATVTKAPSTKAPSIKSQKSVKSVRSNKAPSTKAGTIKDHYRESTQHSRLPTMEENAAVGAGGFAVGEVASQERQRELQHHHQQQPGMGSRGHSLQDHGPQRTQFQENSSINRATSPYGHRPEPVLMSQMGSQGGRESRMDGREGILNRNGTVISRAGTLGRNGTLSRAANGGTIGNRRGAFGRGAGASVGTQPEEVLGREWVYPYPSSRVLLIHTSVTSTHVLN